MSFSEDWYRNHARALDDVCKTLLRRPPDPDFYGTYFYHAVEKGAHIEDIVLAVKQSDEYMNLPPVNDPNPPPDPPPGSGPLPPLVIGNWRGNFLYPARDFFGPACAAFTPARRSGYFSALRERGHTHVLINAEQADWGPNQGHPEWTAGGYDWTRDPAHFDSVLREARTYGLSPCVGIIDQPTLKAKQNDLNWIIARSRALVELTSEHTALYMLSWEIEEVWSHGDIREPNLKRWIKEIDWNGSDVGIHFAAGNLSGGFNFYGEMPSNVVRLYQYTADATDQRLTHESRLIAEVAARSRTKVCAFEHSSPLNQSPTYPEDVCLKRMSACLRGFEGWGLRPEQYGSLNG